jgi:hypothetical protein
MISASNEDSPFIPDGGDYIFCPFTGNDGRTDGVHDTFLFRNDPFQSTHPFTTISHDTHALDAMGTFKRWKEKIPLRDGIRPMVQKPN